MIRFSFAPLPATIAASTTFADAVHPASNVLLQLRPFLRAYSADTSAQRLTLDLGAATVVDVVGLIHGNFLTATIQGNATDAWGGTLSYSSGAITLARSGNYRYHYKHIATTFNARYLSLSIPNQATTDGATYFALGVMWPGRIVSPPTDMLMDPDEEPIEAVKAIQTADGRAAGQLALDDPAWRITGRRFALTEADLAAWREIERQWAEAPGRAALVLQRDTYPAEAYVMRKGTSKWQHGRVYSESAIEMLEVTGG